MDCVVADTITDRSDSQLLQSLQAQVHTSAVVLVNQLHFKTRTVVHSQQCVESNRKDDSMGSLNCSTRHSGSHRGYVDDALTVINIAPLLWLQTEGTASAVLWYQNNSCQ